MTPSHRNLSSRPSTKDPAKRETEWEWRDPEDVSSAMQIRGVSPQDDCSDVRPNKIVDSIVLIETIEESDSGTKLRENSLNQHDGTNVLGISPLPHSRPPQAAPSCSVEMTDLLACVHVALPRLFNEQLSWCESETRQCRVSTLRCLTSCRGFRIRSEPRVA